MDIEEFKKLFPMGDNFHVTGGPPPNKKKLTIKLLNPDEQSFPYLTRSISIVLFRKN